MTQSQAAVQPRRLGVAVIIPAREPGEHLIYLVRSLANFGYAAIVIVDDGSSSACEHVFDRLRGASKVHVLTHGANLGKGRALKTGLNYVFTELTEIEGVVTADADGQHTPADIAQVADALFERERPILGARSFDHEVPARSRFGNAVTRYLCWFLLGRQIKDTQSGLRAFPRKLIPELLTLHGERYEYEMNVLAHLCRSNRGPVEIPISTVYIDSNRSSHFDPILDSMRIYFVLLRFFASSLIAAGIDFAGFSIAFLLTHNVLASFLIGRLSSLVNFWLNRRFVFRSNVSMAASLARYYVLVIVMGCLSYGCIMLSVDHLHSNVYVAKVAVETLLSLISFSVQQTFIFRRKPER